MSQTPPRLTDRARLDHQRRRARALGLADFLQQLAIDEIEERLKLVNRTFTAPATVSGFPDLWQSRFGHSVPDTDTLDLVEAAHDLVIHGMALHWADDPVGQLVQARRALRPDGLFVGVCFGGQTLAELRAALAMAESEIRGGLSPRIAPMGEIRDLGALLQRAGFALPVADSLPVTVTYSDIFALMQDLRAMGETNALAARDRRPLPLSVLLRASQIYATHHMAPDGKIIATYDLVFLTGWAPDASQPQPLRPGSASVRLADALGTTEHKTGDKAG